MVESQQRSGFIVKFLASIGAIFVLFIVFSFILLAYFIHAFSGNVKGLSSSLTNIGNSGAEVNFVTPSHHANYIAGIKLNGEINSLTSVEILEKLEAAKSDNKAIGVLLEVNSPGGSVVPSQEIYDAVLDVKTKKPVVVYVRDMAASGAYYSSASASKIIANRASILGSIGVIMNGFEADKLIQFLKINPVTIKTGALKDVGNPTRPMNGEDKRYLQELIEATRLQFVNDIKLARKITDSSLKFMSDGRVVLAPQALELKLIDAIGTKKLALDEVAKLANSKETPELFYYENIQSFSALFSQKMMHGASSILTEVIYNLTQSSEGISKLPKAEFSGY